MEVDTGAALSIISEATYQSLWATNLKPPLKTTDIKLHTYTKKSLQVLGSIEIEMIYKEQSRCLPLLVVGGNGPTLLGRNWLVELKLERKEPCAIVTYQIPWNMGFINHDQAPGSEDMHSN